MNAQHRSFPHDDIRVSDAERDLAVAELGEHFQAGRLSQDEFDDRSGLALQARTGGDLSTLFTDLPGQGPVSVPPAVDPVADPFFGPGDQRPPGAGLLAARAIIGFIIGAIVVGALLGGHPHGHAAGWLIPVVILVLVFLRLTRLARRR
jgi:hypothetical protein